MPAKNNTKSSGETTALLQHLNKGLFITWCVLLAALLVMVKTLFSLKSLPLDTSAVNERAQREEAGYQPKPFSYYLECISRQNLFKLLARNVKQENVALKPQISPLELLANYSLSGVINGAPAQAIIEDKKAQKTYFLSRGQSLGEFKIDQILDGKVVLELNGQKFELNL